jgi:serine/threonine protein kinase
MSLEKIGKIGYGAYSKIYKVRDGEGGEHAMKICLKNDGYNFGVSYREADIALKFDHPYIVCLRATFQGNPFGDCDSPTSPLDDKYERMSHDVNHLLYELANDSLDNYFLTTEITIPILISILSDVLLGLEYIHLSGYIHRDLRADNILLFYVDCESCEGCEKGKCENQTMIAKISDFGFTRVYLNNDPLTPSINNVYYRAPECLMDRCTYFQNVDVWSLGCMVHVLLQRRKMIQNPIAMTGEAFLGYFSEILPYELPLPVKKRYGITAKGRTFEEFFPMSEEMEDEIESVSSVRDFKDLLLGMFEFDPKKRFTATQCLDSPFFDSVREKITETREAFPPLPRENPVLKIEDCVERKWAMGNFRAAYQHRNSKDKSVWYTDRILFLAMSICDDSINFLAKKSQNSLIIPNEFTGKILTKRQLDIIYIVCLYFAIKYTAGTESYVLSLQDVYPKIRYTEEEFRYAKNFEVRLFTEILDQKIYRPTLYDLLVDEKVPREREVLSLLVYYINGHYNGKPLNEAFAHWKKHVDHYTPK